jgi:hypothetical protein
MKTYRSALARRFHGGVGLQALVTGATSITGELPAASLALGLIAAIAASPSYAQVPNLGTAADFAVLGGSTVTNTGPSVLIGSLGVSPGSAITGFPPGIVSPPGATHTADAVAVQAQVDLINAFNAIGGGATTANLTGQDLGGKTLTPGTYTFDSSAQLTGPLTLNAQGNPNAVFIFNIGSTLTTGSSSSVTVIGGGQSSNVFWKVGSSATIGTTTSFVGDILALTSITLNTGANIACGSALAHNGAVTLDTNNVAIKKLAPCATPLLPVPPIVVPPDTVPVVIPPSGVPVIVPPGTVIPPGGTPVVIPPGTVVPPGSVPVVIPPGVFPVPPGGTVVVVPPGTPIPPGATPVGTFPVVVPPGAIPVALPPGVVPLPPGAIVILVPAAEIPLGAVPLGVAPVPVPQALLPIVVEIDRAFTRNNGDLPQAFLDLTNRTPTELANIVLPQLYGELGTGSAQAGTQAMNSFLSLVTNQFADNRIGLEPKSTLPPWPAPVYKTVYKAQAIVPDPRPWSIWAGGYGGQSKAAGNLSDGTHDRSARTFGYATGLDYRVTPYTAVGFALAGGGTTYGLADGFGNGRSDMFQSAVYSLTRYNSFYLSTALAYAWHRVSTDRTVLFGDRLTASFSAQNIGGRVEGGYRFTIPAMPGLGQIGLTPYGALQMQNFRTPSYTESGSSFALAYDGNTMTTVRTELGGWFDWTIPIDLGTTVALRTRAAWARDQWSDPNITAAFAALPGSNGWTVIGALPARDLLLSSAGAEIRYSNGLSLAAWADGEFAQQAHKYSVNGRVRYSF